MDHRVADLDAGRETISQDTTRFSFQDRPQQCREGRIASIHLYGRGQLADEAARCCGEIRCGGYSHNNAERTKHFFGQMRLDIPCIERGLEQIRQRSPSGAVGSNNFSEAVDAFDLLGALAIGLGNSIGEHRLFAGSGELLGSGIDEVVCSTVLDEHDSRVGTELSRPHHYGPGPSGANLCSARFGRFGKHKDRVNRAELAKEGDRYGPFDAEVEERASSAKGSREAYCIDQGVLNQRFSNIAPPALDEREYTFGHVAKVHGGGDCLSHYFGSAGMGRVALYDNGTACGQRARRVAASDRERKWEV